MRGLNESVQVLPHPRRAIRYVRTESPEPFGSPEVEEQLDMIDPASGAVVGPSITAALVLDGAIGADGSVLYELRGRRAVCAYDMETGSPLESFATEPGEMIAISSFCDLSGTRLLARARETREAMGPIWDREEIAAKAQGDELLRVRIRTVRTALRSRQRGIQVVRVVVLEVVRSRGGLTVGDELEVRPLNDQRNQRRNASGYARVDVDG